MEPSVLLHLIVAGQVIILFLVMAVISDPVVQMDKTQIRGKEIPFEDKTVNQYLGMPYAEPPVGDLRFRKTVPLGEFPDQFDAFYPPPACRQYTETPFPWYFEEDVRSEDCLYVNVWTPVGASPRNPKPVLVWLHSGNHKFGSSSLDHYSGVPLCAVNDIVVVTGNYRIGLFGFLSSDTDEAPGNAGLWDIKELLEWVNKYIIYFGGDPSQITLHGQSSSATIVGYFTLNDETHSLFHRMIMQSGSPVNMQTDYRKRNIELGKKLAKMVGCEKKDWEKFGSATIQCLKNVTEDDMENAEYKMGPNSTAGWHPIMGDEFIPNHPRKSILKGNFHCKPLLIGNNRDEGSVVLPILNTASYGFQGHKDFAVTGATVKSTIGTLFQILPDFPPILSTVLNLIDISSPAAIPAVTDNPVLSKISDVKSALTVPVPVDKLPDGIPNVGALLMNSIVGDSPPDPNCMRLQLQRAAGDIVLLCPTRYFAEKCAEQEDVYYYLFIHRPSNSKFASWMGVTHFSELPFVFGEPYTHQNDYADKEKDLSRMIMLYWGNFVKYGKPDPTWPKYTKEKPIYKVIGGKNGTKPYGKGPHKQICELLRTPYEVL